MNCLAAKDQSYQFGFLGGGCQWPDTGYPALNPKDEVFPRLGIPDERIARINVRVYGYFPLFLYPHGFLHAVTDIIFAARNLFRINFIF
jgi:hypothetical protein